MLVKKKSTILWKRVMWVLGQEEIYVFSEGKRLNSHIDHKLQLQTYQIF